MQTGKYITNEQLAELKHGKHVIRNANPNVRCVLLMHNFRL